MGYANTVKNAVRRAFNTAGDLVDNVVLTQTTDSGFDFATNQVKTPVVSSKALKALFVTTRKRDSTLQASFLLRSEDITDVTIYDTLTTSKGVVWRMIAPYVNDGFVMTINVTKEV